MQVVVLELDSLRQVTELLVAVGGHMMQPEMPYPACSAIDLANLVSLSAQLICSE